MTDQFPDTKSLTVLLVIDYSWINYATTCIA